VSESAERKAKQQRLTNAHHRLWSSEDGKTVLDDIKRQFSTDRSAFFPIEGKYDPINAALRDGQRSVVIYIESRLAAEAKGDDPESL
jgi:hypothetical protein